MRRSQESVGRARHLANGVVCRRVLTTRARRHRQIPRGRAGLRASALASPCARSSEGPTPLRIDGDRRCGDQCVNALILAVVLEEQIAPYRSASTRWVVASKRPELTKLTP